MAFVRHNPNEGGDSIIISASDGTAAESFLRTKDVGYDQFTAVDWSPDGEKILVGVYRNAGEPNQTRLQVAAVDLTDKKLEFVSDKGFLGVKSLKWIKDGSGVVLVGKANLAENSQVWHLSYPGGEARQITSDTTDYGSVSISADGGSMVATRVDVISSFWAINTNTREMKQLTSENKNLLGHGGLSQMPDGKILYAKQTGREINIFSMDENGAGEKQLTSGSGFNQSPLSTPDGKYIVFISNRAGTISIYRMNADGSGPIPLTQAENAMDLQPQISKDGRNVIFVRQSSDGGKANLMKVSIDGGAAVPLRPESNLSEFYPRLSPDGKKLAYHTFAYDSSDPQTQTKVEIVDFNGEKPVSAVTPLVVHVNPEFKFSADSKSLTYINKSGFDNLWNVSLVNPNEEKPLTNFTSGNISNFLWSADGKKLFIVRAIYNSDLVLIKDTAKI
jgi:Tol biopolymer transport system component